MPFPFTFSFSVPGLSNPFSSPTLSPHKDPVTAIPSPTTGKQEISRRRPSPALPSGPTSRKRGWEPAFVEPSQSTTTLASSSGYLDTPAKYRDMADSSHIDELHEAEMIASDIGGLSFSACLLPAPPNLAICTCSADVTIYTPTTPGPSPSLLPTHSFFLFVLSNVFSSPPPSSYLLFVHVS